MNKLIIFTDLDGTLLDHTNYGFTSALPALNLLSSLQYPLIIISSKTSAEIKALQNKLSINYPFAAENGSVIHYPTSAGQQDTIFVPGKKYNDICENLEAIRQTFKFKWSGFSDMDSRQIAYLTELKIEDAKLAKQREASEPLIWKDNEENLSLFRKVLWQKNLKLTQGGRFFHVMSKTSKADALKHIFKHYQTTQADIHWKCAALGDSDNDISMLQAADIAVLVRNPSGSLPDTNHIKNIHITQAPGPEGWNQSVLSIINQTTGKHYG